MIAPHELKNKTFSRALRGYNPVEVDEYFDFLIEKYTEAYKIALELEQNYAKIKAQYSELSNEEESIRSAILKAQKLGEAIVSNAENVAKTKEEDLIRRCAEIVEAAKEKVQIEKENIFKLRKSAIDFQHKLYNDYVKHVEMIKSMDIDTLPDDEKLFNENETLQNAMKEALDGEEITIFAPTSDAAFSEENTKTS